MKIRTKFIIFGFYIFVVTVLLIYLQVRIVRSVTDYSRIYQHTIKSSAIARQYQQNSAFLTQFVRSYVATADQKYEQAYNDCIAISGGTKPTPLNYDRGIYWSIFLGSGRKPSSDGQTKSYADVMQELNFSKEMFDYLTLSKSRSEALVKLEVQAMDIIKSIPRNPDGSIPEEYKGRQLEAINLVNGKAYEEKVSEIMAPINQFFDTLEADNALKLQKAANEVRNDTILFFIGLFIVGLSVGLFLASLGKLIGKNLRLCVHLASEISNGNLDFKKLEEISISIAKPIIWRWIKKNPIFVINFLNFDNLINLSKNNDYFIQKQKKISTINDLEENNEGEEYYGE